MECSLCLTAILTKYLVFKPTKSSLYHQSKIEFLIYENVIYLKYVQTTPQ